MCGAIVLLTHRPMQKAHLTPSFEELWYEVSGSHSTLLELL